MQRSPNKYLILYDLLIKVLRNAEFVQIIAGLTNRCLAVAGHKIIRFLGGKGIYFNPIYLVKFLILILLRVLIKARNHVCNI